mgnify:CR=1 FL=1
MRQSELETYLKQTFGQAFRDEIQPKAPRPEKLEETIDICKNILLTQKDYPENMREERTGFWQYLSDVFRFEGLRVFGLQAAVLFFVCLNLSLLAKDPAALPVFMPLFVLAAVPALLRGQYYNMSEMEAATRASGAQIILAKLVLAGAADLVCFTLLLWLERTLGSHAVETRQLILYAIVPYLTCMALLLRNIRLQKCRNALSCFPQILGFSFFWGIMPKALPGLYRTSAAGAWFIAFIVFGSFFLREIFYIVDMRKRGKMYGIIA